MSGERQFEYFFLHYRPQLAGAQSVIVAVVLFEADMSAESFCQLRTAPGWQSRIQRLRRHEDLKYLEAIFRDIDQQLTNGNSRKAMIEMIEDSFSGSLYVSPRMQAVTADPAGFLEQLASRDGGQRNALGMKR